MSQIVKYKATTPLALVEDISFQDDLALALPSVISKDRMVRIVANAVTKSPELARCSINSFLTSVMSLAAVGLEPDGRLAHLVPFGGVCTAMIDWKGYVQLAYRSGLVGNIMADVIYAGDIIEYETGDIKRHVPFWLRTDKDKPAARGELIGAFALAIMKDGSRCAVVMSAQQILNVQNNSQARNSNVWANHKEEMWKKTAFKRLGKWLPNPGEDLRKALDIEDADDDTEVNVTGTDAPVARPVESLPAPAAAPSPAPEAPARRRSQARSMAEPAAPPAAESAPTPAAVEPAPVAPAPVAPVAAPATQVAPVVELSATPPADLAEHPKWLKDKFRAAGVTWPEVKAAAVNGEWWADADIVAFTALDAKAVAFLVKRIDHITSAIIKDRSAAAPVA